MLPLLDESRSGGSSPMNASAPADGSFPEVFSTHSGAQQPHLEYIFQIRLTFTRVQNIPDMPTGAGRGAVYLDDGVIEGPMLNGRALGNTGGDYALFRPDGVLSFDARYMLETDDGALILMHNRGYLWGRRPDVMPRIREWIFNNGPDVPFEDYYLRACPTFECSAGRYDWLMRHVIVGVGERKADGNLVRYYALT
jgi:hypothetical protein